jgi:hypothetical protein
VSLSLNGGWNGDYDAFLSHGSGFAVLLNRVGRTATPGEEAGYGDAGLTVVFDDASVNGDVHSYQQVVGYAALIGSGGRWVADGRNVSPLTVLDSDTPTRRLDQFVGLSANGDWTLFIADVSNGERSTVQSWGMDIQVVPEPGAWAAVTGLGLATLALARRSTRLCSE